ncbi:MAG: CGGC domain-containing protein [Spirochaetaceae bacterium]|jgi:predicted metal-binding protein|nr:CGGC domain-containing protein [Spirochaetaceae bacterium]
MKTIAILSCLKATAVCSGAACFSALNKRTQSFAPYRDETVEIAAFFHCNGCGCNIETDKEYAEKINRVKNMALDAVHIGKCTINSGTECSTITKIAGELSSAGIQVIRGTH